MAALSLRHRQDVDGLLGGLLADSRYTQDFLSAEVVSYQLPEIQDWMLKTSILDRFCAPLCEALCRADRDSAEANLSGRAYLEWLERGWG